LCFFPSFFVLFLNWYCFYLRLSDSHCGSKRLRWRCLVWQRTKGKDNNRENGICSLALGADSTLVDAQPFKDVGIFSVWLKIAFIYEDSECLSGTTQL